MSESEQTASDMEQSTHEDSGRRCLVAHFEGDYRHPVMLPACIKCQKCHKWIRPEDMSKPCDASGEE